MRNDFAVFIVSHGRAGRVVTIKSIRRNGYTGKIYIIVDNEDEQIDKYKELYKNEVEDVIVFDKLEMSKRTDTADNFPERNVVVYARNACFEIAKDLGLTYFLVLDDDYNEFRFRPLENDILKSVLCKQFDAVCDAMIEFLDNTNALSVCTAQTGDLIGGANSRVYKNGLTRKAMNSFFCKTDRPFKFMGRINEDVNCYVTLGQQGNLFFTIGYLTLDQGQTQQFAGGLTEAYLDLGTYVKSFYSVICNPSCVKISTLGVNHQRIHHRVSWNNCTPQILNEKWKKK